MKQAVEHVPETGPPPLFVWTPTTPLYGAGDFYRKCGFREVGSATYRSAPLIYFELIL